MSTIYDLVLLRIKLRCRYRIAWLRNVWIDKEKARPHNVNDNYISEVDIYLNNLDSLDAQTAWTGQQPHLQSWTGELDATEKTLISDNHSRLAKLRDAFSLNQTELDIIQTCLALTLEPSLSMVYAYLHDHKRRGYVTLSMVARLFGHGRFVAIGSGSPLKKWELIIETQGAAGEPDRIELDPFVRSWLLGNDDLDEQLSPYAFLVSEQKSLSHLPVATLANEIKQQMNERAAWNTRVLVTGPSGSGRTQFAAAVSKKLGKSLVCIQSESIPASFWHAVYLRAQREALLKSHALLWKNLIASGNEWPFIVPSVHLQWLTGEVEESLAPRSGIADIKINLPPIPLKQASSLLLQYLPYTKDWDKTTVRQLLRRHPVTIGQLNTLAIKQPVSPESASEILKASARYRLGNLAQQMRSALTWDDLFIADWLRKQLDEFFYEASERNTLWNSAQTRRLFPQGRGLFALFSGPPGTGKTMAAQIVANSLDLDLFRIDLSAIVSKYVGETSRNLERVLSRAADMNVILLFDEADALFGKRTEIKDAHDRYANTDTNYLLQALEQYPGLVILSSNKKSNIDEGFIRRIRYILEFQSPDAGIRLKLWRRLVAELSGEAAERLDPVLIQLASQLDLTGAQIKFSILSAKFLAQHDGKALTSAHIMAGLERELMKEGRGLGKQMQDILKKVSA